MIVMANQEGCVANQRTQIWVHYGVVMLRPYLMASKLLLKGYVDSAAGG